MPTIHRIGPCVVKIFTNDHEPPHFHVEAADFVVKVVIGSWQVIPVAGRARRLAAVLAWARANEPMLRQRWQETRTRG